MTKVPKTIGLRKLLSKDVMKYLVIFFCFFVVANPQAELVFKQFSSHSFRSPVDFVYPNESTAYVVEKVGKIWRIDVKKNFAKKLILNIKKRLGHANEQGLLCMVLDPNFNQNNFIYLYYTSPNHSFVSRFTINSRKKVDLKSEKVLLKVAQPYPNHNGGQLAFGKDGFLYIGLGDGGAAGDPLKAGQDLTSYLGKILRIDVNSESVGESYAIPSDNPFINKGKGEIYAYGFRNPWTFSFDSLTGQLYCADVGQNRKEEVNLVIKGGNYGWNIKEADLLYDKSVKSPGDLIDPFVSYGRKLGISITGGYVYRGDIISLYGYYLYADFAFGNLWAISLDSKGRVKDKKQFAGKNLGISRFAQDYDKNLYICSYNTGRILKIVGVQDKRY